MSAFVSRMEHSTIVEGQRAWNSTHHGRYVFQTALVREKYEHQHVHIHIHIHNHAHIHFQKYMYQNMCVFAVGWMVVWLGGVVWFGVVC